MNLSDIPVGGKYKIKELGSDPLSRRLLDMGFYKGTEVTAHLKNRGLLELQIGETLIAVKAGDCTGIVIYRDGQ